MGYRPDCCVPPLQRVSAMLLDALPPDRKDRAAATRIANVLMMAFDGYVIGRHLNPPRRLRRPHAQSVRRSADRTSKLRKAKRRAGDN